MKAFLYGVKLQFKMDIRSKTMLITCYLVPLVFFFFMSGIFTSIDPTAVKTLIPAMSVFVITMSALIGVPPSLGEVYGSEIKKMYKANGVPLSLGMITQFISSFIHTLIVCLIVFAIAPIAFQAELPKNLPLYFCSLIVLLSGIMFSATLLPDFMQYMAYIFPATIGFQAMTKFEIWHLPMLVTIFTVLCIVIIIILKIKSRKS